MITEKTKTQIKYTLHIFQALKVETANALSIIEDKQEKHIYDLCLDLLCKLNRLESQYEEIGKLQYLIDLANTNQEIDEKENEDLGDLEEIV